MSKHDQDIPPSNSAISNQPIKVLSASDPATLKLIHEYLDLNKGKNHDGKPITKLRRYLRKANKPAGSVAENVYTFTNTLGEQLQIALDQSVIIFNAENPETRCLYILKKFLAAGGFGRVKNVAREADFAVTSLQTGQDRVIKVIPYGMRGSISKSTLIERAEMERVLGESQGYMLREAGNRNKAYIDLPKHLGSELFDCIRDKTITNFDEKIDIAIEILQQLKLRFHDKGYLHRDLKPDNIIYDQKTKKMRIIDMDFVVKARKSHPSEKQANGDLIYQGNSVVGTPGYQSPELKDFLYSEKSDVYAVGVIFALLELSAQITWQVDNEGNITKIIPVNLAMHPWAAEDIKKENNTLGSEDVQKLQKLILAMTHDNPTKRIGIDDALQILHEIKKNLKSVAENDSAANTATAMSQKEDSSTKFILTQQQQQLAKKGTSEKENKEENSPKNTAPGPGSG